MVDVLIVEDVHVTRELLVHVIGTEPGLRVVAAVGSGEAALMFLRRQRPDVVLMDIHLPGIDGLETTRRIMTRAPVPIVICTASTAYSELDTVMQALEAGALTALRKPRGLEDPDAERELAALLDTLKLMAEVRVVHRANRDVVPPTPAPVEIPPTLTPRRFEVPAPGIGPARPGMQPPATSGGASLVAIGASTGGPGAVAALLQGLPPEFPLPILLVQHIADGFTSGLVDWLGRVSGLPTSLALNGETPRAGRVYVAPDDHHLLLGPNGELRTTRDRPWRGLRPSVELLFRSVAERCGRRGVGVLLTGMGSDGAEGLARMRARGALTFAQDEASCVVFGMPGEAIARGAARHVLPPSAIASHLAGLGAMR